MDFGTLLHMAKKNSEDNKNDNKYYSTKFAPPKKVSKEKKLSDNIQKFLAKKEQEEKAKQREQKEKLDTLLSMRDEKSKNKIRKMLKVTKSANRSVLEDAVNSEHTALTMAGGDQPDQDDYGYVSTEANSFYQKYIEKVKDVKEDKGFAPSRPQSLKDLTGTKERVKAAITREIEEKNSHTRSRSHTAIAATTATPSVKAARTSTSSSKTIYDPEAEKRAEEEERKKREDEERKNRMKNRKPPPPMDFQALLKLAEKKQHEPVALPAVAQKKKEPERLLTLKEKKEYEERLKAREAKERRERERQDDGKKNTKESKMLPSSSGGTGTQRMEANGRIPKLNQAGSSIGSINGNKTLNSNISSERKNTSNHEFKKPLSSSVAPAKPFTASSSSSSKGSPSASLNNTKSSSKSSSSSSTGSSKLSSSATAKNPYGNIKNKQSLDAPGREFPPRDIKNLKAREFPTPDIGKARQFPPPDLRRGPPPPSTSRNVDKSRGSAPKRRILDDYEDDSEYDSELDDFIDDGDCEEDISSHIKAIFGYDKSKYKNLDDGDDRSMESSFAQVQREEFISKKIGIQEDLEDMKLEAVMKKRKMAKKRRLLEDD